MPSRSSVALLAIATLLVVAAPVAVPVAGLGGSGPAPPGDSGPVPAGGDAAVQPTTSASPPPSSSPSPSTPVRTPRANETLPPSAVTYRVQLQSDGDARWTVSVTLPIRDEHDARAFEAQAAEFEASESPLGLDSFRRYAARANATSDRRMFLRNPETSHSRENGNGTLSVSFTWVNFSRVDGNSLAVGDAFDTTNGTWLSSISGNERLLIAPPEGYGVSDAPQVEFVDRAAQWEGPYAFDGREPWIVYSSDASPPTTSTAGPGTTTLPTSPGNTTSTTTGTSQGGDFFSSALPAVLLVAIAAVSATILARYVRNDDDGGVGTSVGTSGGDGGSSASGAAGSPDGSDDASGGVTAVDAQSGPGTAETGDAGAAASAGGAGTGGAAAGGAEAAGAESDGAEAGGAEAGGAGAAVAAGEDADEADRTAADEAAPETNGEVDEALLSDEERVERLLDRNGGRMKQASIVKETGWSNAKVSQLLSAMADDDRIDKLRIGRENLISFPDEDVTDLDSE